MQENKLNKSYNILILFIISLTTNLNIAQANDRVYELEPELPVPFPLCDPERVFDPDPISWRLGIVKVTDEMRIQIIRIIEELGRDPQPWTENNYCVIIY
ncbi:MAG: hypothetical protein KDI92_09305 [Xanthomonadales bacterium]|nr:hypothetical protein [Xanthomonadales bacterium]